MNEEQEVQHTQKEPKINLSRETINLNHQMNSKPCLKIQETKFACNSS